MSFFAKNKFKGLCGKIVLFFFLSLASCQSSKLVHISSPKVYLLPYKASLIENKFYLKKESFEAIATTEKSVKTVFSSFSTFGVESLSILERCPEGDAYPNRSIARFKVIKEGSKVKEIHLHCTRLFKPLDFTRGKEYEFVYDKRDHSFQILCDGKDAVLKEFIETRKKRAQLNEPVVPSKKCAAKELKGGNCQETK